MGMLVNIDGELLAPEKACINVLDHGFLFGDSIYEVVRTQNGALFAVCEHLVRLRNSAAQLKLEIPLADSEIVERIKRTVAAAKNPDSYVRLIVTRGAGEIDLHPASCKEPRTIIIVQPYKRLDRAVYEKGLHISFVGVVRNPRNALNPQIKSGNYLNNVLALIEARAAGANDAVMLNSEGFVAECTTSNLFMVKFGVVKTPSLGAGILSGITRSFVISVAHEAGYAVEETDILPQHLLSADEVFITSTLKNIVPVTKISGTAVGSGVPGPVTKDLIKHFDAFLDRKTKETV
jgi:branched-chain amino acid aminotransferase